jgi:hypothetical protein
MLRTTWVAVVLVLGGLAAPAFAQGSQGATKLQWKFKEGETFYLEDVSTMKIKGVFGDKTFEQTQKTVMVTSYKVLKASPDSAVVVQTIEGVEVKSEGSFSKDLGKLTEKLAGASFTLTLNKDNKITRFEGYEAYIKKLTDNAGDAAKLIRQAFSETLFRKAAEDVFAFVPTKPVSPGNTWKSASVIPLNPFGSFKSADEYTLREVVKGAAKIGWKGALVYTAPRGETGFGPLKVTKGNIKAEGAQGTYYFDIEKGRLKRYSQTMIMRGTMSFDIMGTPLELELSIDMAGTSRTLDTNPLAKK